MARSAHAYTRGSTIKFYEWLEKVKPGSLPDGAPIWICGDCHAGNLGPLADADGEVHVLIRDLDQTVIGNPVHDLIRLGLSLATAVRDSDLPGRTTVTMLEQMIDAYQGAFSKRETSDKLPKCVRSAMRQALGRTWKHLANERIGDPTPSIPRGKRFWSLSQEERLGITGVIESEKIRGLVTLLRSRDDDAPVALLDAAYWVKGCSSLGRLRYAVVLGVGKPPFEDEALCLLDIKEAVAAAAPRDTKTSMPRAP